MSDDMDLTKLTDGQLVQRRFQLRKSPLSGREERAAIDAEVARRRKVKAEERLGVRKPEPTPTPSNGEPLDKSEPPPPGEERAHWADEVRE